MSNALASFVRWVAGLSGRAGTEVPAYAVVTVVVAVAMALVHIVQTFVFVLPSGQFKNLHLGFGILLVFLGLLESTPRRQRQTQVFLGLLVLLTLVPIIYIHAEYKAMTEIRSFLPNRSDTIIAIILMALAFYATARQWGWIIPIIALMGLVYGYYGYLLPGELLFHGGIGFERLIGYSSIPYFQGLLGSLTELSAGTIFMFMMFAGVLKVTGGIDFIIKIAYSIGGRSRAGPAQVAVVASGFMGMISGSSVANVASTGALTIPMMKRFGFKPEFAGAVEAVASTGGQVTPPVMGLAAFLIVGITGIPYLQVMAAAVFPALIYYLYLMVAVHIRAAKQDLHASHTGIPAGDGKDVEANLGQAFLEYGHLILGIVVLVYFLVIQMPPGTAALYSLLALLGLEAVKRLVLHRHTPVKACGEALRIILMGLVEGARSGAQVATVIAVINILVEFLAVTGFAQKLSQMMLELSGGDLTLLMIIAAATCLAFGLGLPTSASYILVALLGAPSLVELGVPLLAAHLFVFYFANVSSITPPVAVASLVGANVAQANFMRTALISVRLGLPGFLLPFLFVVRPEILGIGAGFPTQALVAAAALAAVIALNVAMEGYLFARMAMWERLLLLPAAFGLLYPGWLTTAVGLALLAVVLPRGYVVARRAARTPPMPAADGEGAPPILREDKP